MRHRSWLAGFPAGFLILVLAVLCAPTAAQSADFEEAVAMMISGVEDAWNERDPEALASMFTKKADLHSREGRWYTGPDEIAGYFVEWMAQHEGDVKDIDLDRARLISESLALVDVDSRLLDREQTVTEQVKVTVVVERQLNGGWQFSAWRECTAPR